VTAASAASSDKQFLSHLDERFQSPGPKRILALDGGGVKGLLTSGMLEVVEERLRKRLPKEKQEAFRLCDYFDLIGGTSTGALIATLLALGYKAEDVTTLYRKLCPEIFRGEARMPIVQTKFNPDRLKKKIEDTLGEAAGEGQSHKDMTLDTPLLRTGLAILCKRADTGAPWIITNNPRAKFWDRTAEPWKSYWEDFYQKHPKEPPFNPNAKFLLGDLVRASAAAPLFLGAVELEIDAGNPGRFVDGAISTNNNPSFHLFLAATLSGYDSRSTDDERRSPFGFRWPVGADRLFVLSLGAGSRRECVDTPPFSMERHIEAFHAVGALKTVIQDTVNQNVFALQALSAPPKPVWMNREIEDMAGLLSSERPLLTYQRVDPWLETDWLDQHLPGGPPLEQDKPSAKDIRSWSLVSDAVTKLNDIDRAQKKNLDWLHFIGKTYAYNAISADDFPVGFDIDAMGGGAKAAEQRLLETRPDDIEHIARVAHEALRAWKTAIGQPPGPSWDEAEDWAHVSSREAVAFRIANPSAPASAEHDRWMKERKAAGWTYGPVRDDEKKIHPLLVGYAHLPLEERKKDALILAVIDALWR
jgi:hypothetical protein